VPQGWWIVSTLYDELGIAPTAPASVVKAAFRARMRDLHPDVGGSEAAASSLNEAFEVLSDPRRRAEYDATITSPPPTLAQPAGTRANTHTPAPAATYRAPVHARTRHALQTAPAIAAVTVWTAIATALLLTQGLTGITLLPVAVIAVAAAAVAVVAVLTRSWQVAVIAATVGVAAATNLPRVQGWSVLLAFVTTATAILLSVLRWQQHRTDRHTQADTFWDTLANTPGADAWFVVQTQPEGPVTRALLEHIHRGDRATRPLWGEVPVGVYIVLAADHDEPLAVATGDALSQHRRPRTASRRSAHAA